MPSMSARKSLMQCLSHFKLVDEPNTSRRYTKQLSLADSEYGKECQMEELGQFTLPKCNFPTGSTYEGTWDILGFSGYGVYTYTHGVIYEGNFRDGLFDGEGTLLYPMGQKVHGIWVEGHLKSWTYEFSDGLLFTDSWNYCKYPDRRFAVSIKNGLRPADIEYMTNEQPARKIPEGCYDTGDGFYNPKNKCAISAYTENKIIRIPNEEEERWIISHCRKAWDEPTLYRPDLYPNWTTGRQESTADLMAEAEENMVMQTLPYDSI